MVDGMVDLPAECFPVRVWIRDELTLELLWSATVDGPGVMTVPSFRPRRVVALVQFANEPDVIQQSP